MADKERPEVLDRLRSTVAKAGGVAAIALKTGIKERTLSRYLGAGSRIPAEAMFALSRATNASLEWLMSGEEAANNGSVPKPNPDSVLIPMLNVHGSSGHGVANGFVEIIDQLPFSAALLREIGVRPENAHFIRNKGDSNEPTIADGAIVLVDASRRKIRDEGFYALVVDGDVLIKRVQKSVGGGLTLISDNPRYAPETVYSPESLRVEGKVFWTGGGV